MLHLWVELSFFITSITSSCDSDDVVDPTLGEWVLVGQKSNGIDVELDNCRLQSIITIEKDRIYWDNYFIDEDTEIFENSMRSERLKRGKNNVMVIDPVSVFNQNLRLELREDQIWYSFDAWDVSFDNGVISTRVDLIYEKVINE